MDVVGIVTCPGSQARVNDVLLPAKSMPMLQSFPRVSSMFPTKVEGLIQCLTVVKQVTATPAGAGQSNIWYIRL
jgi:hypothetical protein